MDDDQDEDNQDEDEEEEEGDYSDEDDSDDSSFQLTRSMIARINKTEVNYADFDQNIRNIFKQYNE